MNRIWRVVALLAAVRPGMAADAEFFEKKVRPVLAAQCYSCHAEAKQFGGLRVDSRDRLLRGGKNGPAIVAGKPEESLLIRAIRHDGRKMPMGGKLRDSEIAALEEWVREGAPWPAEAGTLKLAAGDPGFYDKLRREHWAYQPVKRAAAPAGAANPVDGFVRAHLAKKGVTPLGRAAESDLRRRVANVLTGLPPRPAEYTGVGYAEYVDRLLASPRFGEQWARHWMDVVRYAETYGYEWNYEIPGAWRYRDYLIRAFNEDVPYDQFVREHIAGDLLEKPRTREGGKWNESVLGTTFFRLGEMGHDDCIQFREIRTDVVDNQIDTLTKAFQGLTVACARCHDHKIDPIPTEDYYSLYGILDSSRPVTRTLNTRGPDPARRARLEALKGRIRAELAAAWRRELTPVARELRAAAAWRSDAPEGATAAAGLDPVRVDRWLRLLERPKPEWNDLLTPVMRAGEWTKFTAEFAKEAAERETFNREKFVAVADFGRDVPAGWSVEGLGLAGGPAAEGDFGVATESQAAILGVYPAGLYTNLLSDRLNGVLRSPVLPKGKKYLSLRVVGGHVGAQRTIVDHCVLGEDHQLLDGGEMKWLMVPTKGDQQLPVYVELSTKADNPRLPERPGKFKGFKDSDLEGPRSYFGVTRAYLHDEKLEPKAELGALRPLVAGEAATVIDRFAARAEAAVRQWGAGRASAEDTEWLEWLLRQQVLTNSRNLTPALRALTEEYRKVERGLETAEISYGMGDFDPGHDHAIFEAGQAKQLGRVAPRHFLSLMPEALRPVRTRQSGRRELAEAMANPANPLTARVMVNRVWHWVFGRGLVATTDNFGRYGETPADAVLLDYLAARFIEEGWSVKKLVRLMVTSETFQRASQGAGGVFEGRYPVRRLEAEQVRDAMLAVSGRLDGKMYGESVALYRNDPKEYRRLFGGPLDGDGRRSVYLKITRMEGPRFLELFDQPPPLQTRGNRDVTNVPSQALALLNDPFVLDQAGFWARRLTAKKDDAVDARLSAMYAAALDRAPTESELERWRALVKQLAAERQVTPEGVLGSEAIWKDVAHTFFNLKEFLYLR